MINLLRRLARRPAAPPDAKASRAGALVALDLAGRPRWTPRDYAALAREGYQRNAIAYGAIRLIAGAAGRLPVAVMAEGRTVPDHPLALLLNRPNERQSLAELIETVATHLLIAGNAYVEQVAVAGPPRELHALRPDRMRVVPGTDGWPEGYEYRLGERAVRYRQDGAVPPILHLANAHPLDDHYGLAPLEAAATALDIHNAAADWNKALLDNAARPSGALVYAGEAGLGEDQFARLKTELEQGFQGARNAGRPLLLEGGLDWKPMALSPKDMDFLEARNMAAREIALCFGVPPMLLGIPGDATYANYAEANRSLWRQTVVPLALRIVGALERWLGPAYPDAPRLVVDLDQVEGMAADRDALWRRVGAAGFLSDDEKREAVGYAPAKPTPG